jgi:hypothetical protein
LTTAPVLQTTVTTAPKVDFDGPDVQKPEVDGTAPANTKVAATVKFALAAADAPVGRQAKQTAAARNERPAFGNLNLGRPGEFISASSFFASTPLQHRYEWRRSEVQGKRPGLSASGTSASGTRTRLSQGNRCGNCKLSFHWRSDCRCIGSGSSANRRSYRCQCVVKAVAQHACAAWVRPTRT